MGWVGLLSYHMNLNIGWGTVPKYVSDNFGLCNICIQGIYSTNVFTDGLLQCINAFSPLMGSAKLRPVSCKDVRFHVLLLAFRPELKDRS